MFDLFLVPAATDFTSVFHSCCSPSSKSHSHPSRNIHREAFLLGFSICFSSPNRDYAPYICSLKALDLKSIGLNVTCFESFDEKEFDSVCPRGSLSVRCRSVSLPSTTGEKAPVEPQAEE